MPKSPRTPGGHEEAVALRESARERLAACCRGCAAEGSDLHSAELCPCLVALVRRRLEHALASGDDPGVLSPGIRGALHLQAWAAAEPPATADRGPLAEAHAELAEAHASCALSGCLTCQSREALARARPLTRSRS